MEDLFDLQPWLRSGAGVTIVVPVYEEAENVNTLMEEIDGAMSSLPIPWECLWVDDGSADDTSERLAELCGDGGCHRLLRLANNQGQSAALAAGFADSAMPLIATMDGDGQNDPADLRRMIDLIIAEDLDVVGGYRTNRHSAVRALSSRVANAFRNAVTRDHVRDVGCSLRVMRARCLDGIPVFRGMHRFLPTLIRLNGYEKQRVIPVRHRERTGGQSKYGIWNRLWVGVADTLAIRWWAMRKVTPHVESRFPEEHRAPEIMLTKKEKL